MSFFDWKEIRIKSDLVDDTDHVDAQSSPPDDELRQVPSVGDGQLEEPATLEVMIEYIDGAEAPVTGAGRGTADVQFIKLVDRPNNAGLTIVDTVEIAAVPSYRPVLVDSVRTGTQYWVRLTNITAPAGATGVRIFGKEQPES